MNITMTNVVFIDQQRNMRPFDNFLITARNIKYIHIPKEVKKSILEYFHSSFLVSVHPLHLKSAWQIFEKIQ